MMKRIIALISIIFTLVMTPEYRICAKDKPRLSANAKTLCVGKEYKIKLKNATSKVKWKTNKKSIISIARKNGNTITIKAKKPGKAVITSAYKGKKYKCRITVKESKVLDNPVLNAADVTLYYLSDTYKPYIQYDENHLREFRFRISGTKEEVVKWELSGEDAGYFKITDYGLVTADAGPIYGEFTKSATVKATLSNGKTLTATVQLYSEANIYMNQLFENFKNTYITDNMTEKEKVEKIAWYIGTISDYDAYNSDWMSILLKGKGDCMASRYAVMYMCQYLGIKAQARGNVEYHGQTLVKADGVFYMVVTGYDEPKPRSYTMYEISQESLQKMGNTLSVIME